MSNIEIKPDDCIVVYYSFVDGAHFFTSRDVRAKGLCAASTDLSKAFHEVNHQLKTLLKKNHGIDNAEIVSRTTLAELEKWAKREIEASSAQTREGFLPVPSAKMNWKMAKAA